MKGLLIEDDPAFSGILRRYLEDICSEITAALTFKAAMERMHMNPVPNLITLDLNLTDSDTETTIERIREIRAINEESVIIVITGMVEELDKRRIIAAGGDLVILKQDMMAMSASPTGFLGNLYNTVVSLIRAPDHYQKNVKILELMATRLAMKTQRLQ